jgi:hypothetical protein
MSEMVPVRKQRFQRAETEQLVKHVNDEAFALGETERHLLLLTLQNGRNQRAQLRLRVLAPHGRQAIEVQAVQQLGVHAPLERLIVWIARVSRAVSSRNTQQAVSPRVYRKALAVFLLCLLEGLSGLPSTSTGRA